MGGYDVIYQLKPVREVEPGWWKLAWRPVWRGTFSVYWDRWCGGVAWSRVGLGMRTYRMDARNGWKRNFKQVHVEVWLLWWTLNAWVKWGFVVHQDGPSDVQERRALDIPAGLRAGANAESRMPNA